MAESPLGHQGSLALEFKTAEALRRPAGIAREVVGMLNARSEGEVWVGVREEAGKAVEFDPVSDAGRERDRLVNAFVELIEPPPVGAEVRVEVVGEEELLRVVVGPSDRPPFALLQREGRAFLIRNGSRNRSLHRTELEDFIRRATPARSPSLQEELDKRVEELRSNRQIEGLWLAAAFGSPRPEQGPETRSLDLQESYLKSLLMNPEASGSRHSGWVVASPHATLKLDGKRLAAEYRVGEQLLFGLSLYRDGALVFCADPERLADGKPGKVHPLALLEYCTSFTQLLAALVEQAGADDSTLCRCTLDLTGIDGWELRPYSPDNMGYVFAHAGDLHAAEVPLQGSWTFTKRELVENPDACAWRIVRYVYEAFGMTEDKIPREFDPRTKRLQIGH